MLKIYGKGTYAYQKAVQTLIWQIIKPGTALSLGGTWRTPVLCGLLDKSFLKDIREDETFEEASFEREYESTWSGHSSGAYFDADSIDKNRVLENFETSFNGRKDEYYIGSVDVARIGCQTVATIFKVTPQPYGGSLKSLVNIYVYEGEHFNDQAIALKKLWFDYRLEKLVIDINGNGIGLMDAMVLEQIDKQTGDALPPFTLENDDTEMYKKYNNEPGAIKGAVWGIKAGTQLNSAMHVNAGVQLRGERVRLLVDERNKKAELLASTKGASMSALERAHYLRPYTLTGVLKEEMLNLRQKGDATSNIILEQERKGLLKDKFSAFEMGLYYIKLREDQMKKRKKFDLSNLMLIN
ncbi:MAG: hypothetical protein ACRCZZ_00585 [Phocaeicola sp.]